MPARRRRRSCWQTLLEAGVSPAGLGARDTLRLEVCFHLHGNEMGPDRNPIEAGLGWCCKEETGFIGSEAIAAARAEGTAEKLVALILTERGIPRGGNPLLLEGDRRRRADQRHLRALARSSAPGWDTFAPTWPSRARRSRSTSAAHARRRDPADAAVREEEDLRRRAGAEALTSTEHDELGESLAAEESYPDDLRYHPEHDWARIEGEEATFGITWYAQDALGEVVFFEPPEVGADGQQGRGLRRGRVGQGRLRRVRAALGRDHRRQRRAAGENPEAINNDPYGEGWMVKVKLTDTAEVEQLIDVAAYKEMLED